MSNPKALGALMGLAIGVVFVWQGALDAFFTALFILAGWAIGKYLAGEIPVVDILLERFFAGRNREPPD